MSTATIVAMQSNITRRHLIGSVSMPSFLIEGFLSAKGRILDKVLTQLSARHAELTAMLSEVETPSEKADIRHAIAQVFDLSETLSAKARKDAAEKRASKRAARRYH